VPSEYTTRTSSPRGLHCTASVSTATLGKLFTLTHYPDFLAERATLHGIGKHDDLGQVVHTHTHDPDFLAEMATLHGIGKHGQAAVYTWDEEDWCRNW